MVWYKNQESTLKATKNYNMYLLYTGILCILFLSSFALAQDAETMEPAALKVIGLRDVVQQDPNLTGLGVRIAAVCRSMTYEKGVGQGDYRFSTNHTSLLGANVVFEDGSRGQTGVSSHATAIG
jgi:hypothetical protein